MSKKSRTRNPKIKNAKNLPATPGLPENGFQPIPSKAKAMSKTYLATLGLNTLRLVCKSLVRMSNNPIQTNKKTVSQDLPTPSFESPHS